MFKTTVVISKPRQKASRWVSSLILSLSLVGGFAEIALGRKPPAIMFKYSDQPLKIYNIPYQILQENTGVLGSSSCTTYEMEVIDNQSQYESHRRSRGWTQSRVHNQNIDFASQLVLYIAAGCRTTGEPSFNLLETITYYEVPMEGEMEIDYFVPINPNGSPTVANQAYLRINKSDLPFIRAPKPVTVFINEAKIYLEGGSKTYLEGGGTTKYVWNWPIVIRDCFRTQVEGCAPNPQPSSKPIPDKPQEPTSVPRPTIVRPVHPVRTTPLPRPTSVPRPNIIRPIRPNLPPRPITPTTIR
jgi:hypothetical protein